MLYTAARNKRYQATVKCLVTVDFCDDEISDLNDQAAEAFMSGDYIDPEIVDITDVECIDDA